MKNILVVHASPRPNGNTARLAAVMVSSLKEAGAAVEEIHLQGKRIYGCQECFICDKMPDGSCALNDDMPAIHAAVREADGLVLCSPVFMWHMTAQAKAFMDRLFCMVENNQLQGKKMALVATAGGDAFDGLDLMTASLMKFCQYTKIEWCGVLYQAPVKDPPGEREAAEAKKLAEKLVRTV